MLVRFRPNASIALCPSSTFLSLFFCPLSHVSHPPALQPSPNHHLFFSLFHRFSRPVLAMLPRPSTQPPKPPPPSSIAHLSSSSSHARLLRIYRQPYRYIRTLDRLTTMRMQFPKSLEIRVTWYLQGVLQVRIASSG